MKRWVDPLARTAYRGAYTLARAYWFVRRPHTHGVFVGVWHDGRVLLLQNSYKHQLSMPGGGMEKDESPAEAGARELHEEVGVRVDATALRPAFETVGTTEHKHDHVRFLELDVTHEPPLVVDEREVTWAAFIDLETALRLPVSPLVRAYLEHARQRRG
ncbi:NUDIX hydrolase [Myxococcus sp. K15C18031901]|uniref:NUDIX hydrolase n=1 Tax=Myxococcus dinghuensis TaxID=2906761 RepID=UPI0020A7CDC9|nr:NUDIX domain-containing protein [Myxococcus dinghuensis]MCP3100962.1 NUDIX hydrolase [Myxococcus dinghuensis]